MRETEPIGRQRVAALMARELERFERSHRRSRELHRQAERSLLSGVPMNWMTRWPGGHPVFFAAAEGALVRDVDGNEYDDFCLGDTGAMSGHSPAPTVAALAEHGANGITTMLPATYAAAAGEALRSRFGLSRWQFTLSATDANRFVVRICRQITGRQRILVHNHCYHGSVDETVVTLGEDGRAVPRTGNVGAPVHPALTTRVVEINDLEALERELAEGDVACVLVEPVLTNIGIVLADDGYHAELRRLTREHGTILVIDETHTFCCGPGGYTAAYGLEPDAVTIGKPIAGGVPAGAYGMSDAVAAQVIERTFWREADVGGVGGTLAGNALSLGAIVATLGEVLTEGAFEHMIALGERFEAGVADVIAEHELPWTVTRLGCRVEYMFSRTPPRTGAEAAAAFDPELDALLHLAMLNRGILMTPFHMMALMCPATVTEQVDRHTDAFAELVADLVGPNAVL
jgi:glutamate-1-semialdehyde aminotransferase